MMLCRGAKPLASEIHGYGVPTVKYGFPHIRGSTRPHRNAVEKTLPKREPAKRALGVDEDDKLAEERQLQAQLYLEDY